MPDALSSLVKGYESIMSYPDVTNGRERVATLQATAIEVGSRLRSAIAVLLDRLADTGTREQRGIQSTLNLSQSVASRLMAAVRVDDPLATLACAPAPEGLRKMLRGATRAGMDPTCLQTMEAAIVDVETLLDREIGGRHELDVLLSEWVLDSRAGFELRHKASAFRSMSALRGLQARAAIVCAVIHPTADPRVHDAIAFDALIGCRRLRPSAVLYSLTSFLAPQSLHFRVEGLEGQPIAGMRDLFLPEFSTVPWESLETRQYDTFIETTVRDLPLGKDKGVDIVTAQVFRGGHRALRGDGPPTSGVGGQAEPPVENFIVDALVHDDVWPGTKPELRVFDTVVRGITHPDNPLRQGDRLDMLESVIPLGRDSRAFRIAEFPRYTDMIQQTCAKLGWDVNRLRGFRCKIRYPVYGSQIGLAFPLPERAPE